MRVSWGETWGFFGGNLGVLRRENLFFCGVATWEFLGGESEVWGAGEPGIFWGKLGFFGGEPWRFWGGILAFFGGNFGVFWGGNISFIWGRPRSSTPGTEEDCGAAFTLSPPGPLPLTGTSSPRGDTTTRGLCPQKRPPKKRYGEKRATQPHPRAPKRGVPSRRGLSRPEGPEGPGPPPPPRSPGKGRCPPAARTRPRPRHHEAAHLAPERGRRGWAEPSGLRVPGPPRRPGDGPNRRRHLPSPPPPLRRPHCAGAGRPPRHMITEKGGEMRVTWRRAP